MEHEVFSSDALARTMDMEDDSDPLAFCGQERPKRCLAFIISVMLRKGFAAGNMDRSVK